MKGSKVGKIIAMVFAGIFIAATMGLVLGFGLRWLWNALMPEIFGLPPITYWQAVGLFVLSHLLFKGHHHCGPSREKKSPWKKRHPHGSTEHPHREPPDPMEEKIRKLLDGDEQTKE